MATTSERERFEARGSELWRVEKGYADQYMCRVKLVGATDGLTARIADALNAALPQRPDEGAATEKDERIAALKLALRDLHALACVAQTRLVDTTGQEIEFPKGDRLVTQPLSQALSQAIGRAAVLLTADAPPTPSALAEAPPEDETEARLEWFATTGDVRQYTGPNEDIEGGLKEQRADVREVLKRLRDCRAALATEREKNEMLERRLRNSQHECQARGDDIVHMVKQIAALRAEAAK